MFGKELSLPCDLVYGSSPDDEEIGEPYVENLRKDMDSIHELAQKDTRMGSDRMKDRYDVKAEARRFNEGDLVWLYNPRKPNKRRDVCIKKTDRAQSEVVHINQLAPYKGNHNEDEEDFVHLRLQTVRPVGDQQFQAFIQMASNGKKFCYGVAVEKVQDFFQAFEDHGLVHCVSTDLRMSREIADQFRRRCGRLNELKNQGQNVGSVLR
ncbi:hypothetical protein ILUMI_08468 [Ignelater luminosus]|uniref:Uncharacterized protein n=1 Tax=Ignelater luminosus TaxID=2038154 RepID=A0A8K0D626_IGNLU|nr:hypothetical protein ILUMI_08468 [Ignelater luminosus]